MLSRVTNLVQKVRNSKILKEGKSAVNDINDCVNFAIKKFNPYLASIPLAFRGYMYVNSPQVREINQQLAKEALKSSAASILRQNNKINK